MVSRRDPGIVRAFHKIALIGVGLLGGSLGLCIKQRNLAGRVEGFVRRAASVGECEGGGVVDKARLDIEGAVEGADLVILCTPLAQMRPLVERMLPALKRGAIVTDVGSVKGSVVRDLEPLVREAGAWFVGSHPMAGSEKMGVAHAQPGLFQDAVCVVTPTRSSSETAVRRLRAFWKAVGARTLLLTPALHDELVARSSHLPHLVAAGLVNLVLSPAHGRQQALLCANGFRDTTRVASGSIEMWRDIAAANRRPLSRVLGVFIRDLTRLRKALDREDRAGLVHFLDTARKRRETWCERCSSPE